MLILARQTIHFISFNMAFGHGWAHSLKWARHQEFSAGRKIGPQPTSKPLSSGRASVINRDVISNLCRSWICPRISRRMQKIKFNPRNIVSLCSGGGGSALHTFYFQSILLPGRELESQWQVATFSDCWDCAGLLCLQKPWGTPTIKSKWQWVCWCVGRGTSGLDLSSMQGSRLSTKMARTGKSNRIRSKKLVCKEESQRTQDLHKTTSATEKYLKGSKCINIKKKSGIVLGSSKWVSKTYQKAN